MPLLLVFAGVTSAHTISVVLNAGTTGYDPSDTLVVDVMLDTEGEQFKAADFAVQWDDAVPSPRESLSLRHPVPGEYDGWLYHYPTADFFETALQGS